MVECIAFFLSLGAVLFYFFEINFFVAALVSLSIVVVLWFWLRTKRSLLLGILLGFSFFSGVFLLEQRLTVPTPDLFGKRALEATIVSVDRRMTESTIVVRDGGTKALLHLSLPSFYKVLPGDKIAFHGTIALPRSFLTASGRLFPYPQYLKSKGIVGVVYDPVVTLHVREKMSLAGAAATVRFWFADTLAAAIPFPIDGIVAGMIVGYQGSISSDIKDLFRDTGVLHVLVLSGYNITLLAGFLGVVLRFISFRARTVVTMLAIVLLVLVSGSGIASVRAGIMGSIALFAGLSLKTYQPIRALVLAYLFFFFLSPLTIFFDPGFHLSFLATTYMVLFFSRFLSQTTAGVFNVREIVLLAFSIPLFMLPYTMYFSGNVPLATIIANIVVAFFVPLLMVGGVAVVLFSWLPPFSMIIGAVVGAIGMILVHLLFVFEKLPLWNTPFISGWIVLLFYSGMFLFFFRRELRAYALYVERLFGRSCQKEIREH